MAKNEDNIVGWFTKNGAHIPIYDGETSEEAARRFFESKRSVTEANETKKNWELKRREEERKKIEGLHRGSGDERFTRLAEKSKEEAVSRRLREEQELREAEEYFKAKDASLKGEEVQNFKDFVKTVAEAKASTTDGWRTIEPKSYTGVKMFTKDGSTVGVSKDGSIVSLCSKQGGATTRDMLTIAVKNDGKSITTYSGDHTLMCSQGFKPVSWKLPTSTSHGEPTITYEYVGKGNVPRDDFNQVAWLKSTKGG